MKLTAEQIERANLVSLPQFLTANGFELKKSGREYIWKEHDSLHIYDNENGERGRWFRFSEDKGGDNISFVREYMGKSFVEAVEMLNGEQYERTVFHRSRPKEAVNHEIVISENTDAKRVFAYLCKTRGLDFNLVSSLVQEGKIVQENRTGNVVFKITDENGKLVGAEKVGTSTQHKYKGIATGSASGYGFEICKGNGENLLFFESSIDLLSYLQMHEPDNHRLVSMMGVKPGIVLDTMHRYGIPPENVYLCSDNDKAGNEFAERLMREYPEMKRIVTTERYKDWNDMLRDIPKVEQEKTPKEVQMINYYGNKIWNDATDNREKSIVTMSVYDFEAFQQKLDNSGINYYAYSRDDSVSIAIADKDVALFGQLAGVPDISARKSTQSYVPPEKNIFGTAEYRYIPDKTYISADRDTILKMAELMQREDIQFSGRVYPAGKGTLTISNSDRYRVNGIQRSVENMRKQFAEQKKADVIGNRAYRNIREKHYYHSRLTAKQYDEIKPFFETNASYSGIIRDDKVFFTVEKRDAQNFQRSLDTAIREVALIHSMQALNMPMDRMAELSPLMHRLAMEDAQIQLDSFFDARYDDAQFGEMISLVNAYLDQPVYERYGEHSRLSEMLDAKNSFDRSIELSDFFAQHEFSHEQKSAITAMFVGDVTRAQIDVIDETFTAEEIQQFGEILHNSLDENAVAEFLANRTKPELTEMEQAFLESAIEPVMAKSVLAWDEIEDLGYIFFEEGYIDKYSASDRAMYGNGVYEKDIYEIADRMRHGENIHADLTRALLGNQQTFTTKNDHTFHVTYNKEDITATFGNAERSVSYDAVGEAFLSLFENEYKDILKAREEEKRKEAEAETPQEEKQDYVVFSWGKDPEWFTESEILYDFAKQHPNVSLALANAVFEYLDEKQHTERAIPELNAGWYKKSDFVISGVQNGEDFNYEGRFDIGDGKGTGGGSLIDHIRDFQTGIINSDRYPYDNSERKAAAQESLDVFIPFLEAHSQLTAEEMQILAEFKAEYPIRTEPVIEKAHGKFRIMQLPPAQDENDPYHGIRFFSKEFNAEHGIQLNHTDYVQVFEGNLSEYPADRILESIYERMNIGEKPDGYTGHSLSVSDVIITDIDGVETAYYCNDVGFTEMPEYFREKEILPEIYQLITNGGLDGGIDRKKEYSSAEDAMNAGYKYMSEGYPGFCVVNTETQAIEKTVGDFPYEKAFSPEFLKNNGLWGAAHDAQQLMEEQDKPVTLRDVVDRYFGTDCESAETADGEWKLQIYDGTSENLLNGDIVGVLYHNSEPVVDIHNNRGDFTLVARTSEAEQIAHDIAEMMHDRRPDQNFTITVPESQIVTDFKAKTDEMFHAVDGYTPHEIENVVKSFVFTTFYENGITADIGDIAVTGSRSRGIETDNSDIDIVVEVRNSELKEDALFNILHEEGMDIGGITVDINPIRPEETGTLESYLPTAEAYLSEKMKSEPVVDDTMIHISEEQALSYFDNDRFAVYLIYDDGTEGQAQNRNEIISHTGELGIEKAEWDKYQAHLDTAKSLINEFCEKEFDTEADFSNLSRVDLAYTTDEETGIEIQSYADLENYRIVKEYDGKAVSTEQYDSLTDMCGTLQNLEFGDLVYLSDEEKGVENAEQEPEKEAVNTEKAVSIEKAVDEDAPLFADADVIEQIQENEKADVPFWETPVIEGEQLSLFGDEPVPMKSERKPVERNTKSSHTAEELEYLKAELMRGTGFEDGKFRMQEYFEENHPSVQEFAQKLKNEFGIGGHSGYGDVSFADHDGKGISIEFKDHSKLTFSWNEAAKMLTDMINRGEYITEKDIQERIRHAKYIVENISPDTADAYDKRQLEKAHSILDKYKGAEAPAEKPVQETNVTGEVTTETPTAEPVAESPKTEKHDTIEVGDRFKNLRNGDICEVVSLTGAVPWQTDQCTVQRENGGFAKLFDTNLYEFIGNAEKTAEAEKSVADTPVAEPIAPEQPEKTDNFVITDDALGEGGAKNKFRNNLAAIQTLKQIEREKRTATPEEQQILSQYVGWGGIASAFDSNNPAWANEYAQLKEALTPQEYAFARSTVLDAFFTSPVIIDGIYDALDKFGFDGGNVLEPAMGVGNFFGRMPEDMRKDSKLYGVEIDSISGRIAKALYPDADIAINGFEKNSFQNGCFDVAVGNVPFGELPFKDEKHNTTKLHDYFFAETMDKLKNGGIMAFVTSAGTLDKRDETTRQMLADKADFIGAIRLPGGKNGAFRDNAGTEVTTDIVFLQKHEGKSVAEMSEIPDWVHIGETADGLPINKYFEKNPDMVLGTVVEGNKLYGSGTMVVAEDDFDLKSALAQAVSKLSADISNEPARDVYAKTAEGTQVQIPSNLRNYSFFMQDDKVYFKKNNAACEFRFDKKNAQHGRVRAFIEMRDLTRELIEAQEMNKPDAVITDLQAKLNQAYDTFYAKYGLIHSQTNKRYFSEDVSYNLVAGLEKKYDKTQIIEKSDIFTKRTIQPPKAVDHVETAMEALTLSVAEKAKVDFEYMSSLTGKTEDELKQDLVGEIFKVPHTENEYQTASEYLSGDIRKKLKAAEEVAEYDADFNINVTALNAAMPEPLKAGDIDVKLGATWIDPKIYEQFMYETFQTPSSNRADRPQSRWSKPSLIKAEYSEHTGSWHITNKAADRSVLTRQKFGSHHMNAYDILEHILNLKEPKVYKTVEVPDGMGDTKEKRVVDIDATRVVQRKAEDIRKAFKSWIFRDPERREAIVQKYNELFNSVKPREYDGSALTFPMMNSDIHLHEHQKNAIAHAMFGGNTLFAHCVGAGKTFEMIATAMESKRLGLCTKSMFAVPNHLTEQIGDDFQKLYPGANILVATKKDFQKENRQQLFAKIATGNFDAVIIGHSQLGMIPMSVERQKAMIQGQIDDILLGIEELKKSEGSKFQIKSMERTRKSLEKQLSKLEKSHDDTVTFEQLGVDKLFIDEAHEFKNLFTPTKLSNIAGISTSASQKALDLFMKCQYLDEKTGGKGVTFATGTPISNSVTELHTMMRYLEYGFLKDHGLQHFDSWVSTFGEQKTDWELAPAGNKFKERTRIAQYTGMPELMSMFKQVADIRTADTLNLDVPECDFQVVQVEATPFQMELVQELADRADAINAGNVDPSIDNMLKITSDGRKLGLDPRLIDASFEDDPSTKLNRCVDNVVRIHEDTAEEKLTQIIFCDLGVPHKSSGEAEVSDEESDNRSVAEAESLEEECDFCVYTDIKSKLIAKGVPEGEIAFIHDAKTEKQKSELFEKVRKGEVRVLLGSTAKMGTGTNVQDRLIAVHDLDIPWRPADLEQRAGRIIRQGNQNKKVQIFRYVTKSTFDAYSYQTLENKQKFISQIMTSKTPARKCEDVDQQALTYSEIKALCTGDERIKEKLMLDNEVKELRVLNAEHQNTVFEMQDKIKAFPEKEAQLLASLEHLHADREHLRQLPIDPERKLPVFKMTIKGTEYTDRKEAAKALEDAAFAIRQADTPVQIGEFQGFPLSITVHSNLMGGGMTATMQGEYTHSAKLIESFMHNLNRIEAGLYNIDGKIDKVKSNLAKLRVDHEEAQKIVAEPFPQAEELKQKEERLETLTTELNLAAAEAKKNAPKRERTCYFERAKLKKEAFKRSKQPSAPKKNKAKNNPGLE